MASGVHQTSRRPPQQTIWGDMFVNLQTAYSDLTSAQFQLEQRVVKTEAERDLFRQLVDSMSDALFVMDRTGHVVRINPAAVGLLECEETALIGCAFAEVCGSKQIPSTPWQVLARDSSGRLPYFDVEIETRAGHMVPVSISLGLVRDRRGKITGMLAVMRDITARKQAEAEIIRLNDSLRLRATELAAANRELEAFSYSVSHDLRAPLRAMDGFSRILLEEQGPHLSPDAQRYLGFIRDNAQQMDQLIQDLLAFSRLSRQLLKKEWVATAEIVRQVADGLRLEQEGRRVEISLGDLPPTLADPTLLKQVFVNLLTNALKFTRQREVAQIEVSSQTDVETCVYYVKDNGVGFDMRYVHKLFGVFQR
ncbi:MAG: sensor histidine kinase, partial [Candidatus Entotheonellia bacterium]